MDGGTSTDYYQDSCTHTKTRDEPWWRVDLGSSVPVTEVRIVNRDCTGDCESRLNSFEIRIGKLVLHRNDENKTFDELWQNEKFLSRVNPK